MILYKYTVDLDPKISWPIISTFYFILAIFTLIMVVEPNDVDLINKQKKDGNKRNIGKRIKILTLDLFASLKENK